ncbi:anti-sigma factor domain-containing protein [Rhodococcus qingshengii]|uniref:anti-sigma factor n=1 Tax=Rhodococcus qingshengii TaxID=334542 RepID=UPI0010A6B27F|nr:anti-sigma factor [Rhodococcus qingshengii]THJ65712.1 anti-sigma factor [Rhodococcus qingshengii]
MTDSGSTHSGGSDPLALAELYACNALPDDERRQLEVDLELLDPQRLAEFDAAVHRTHDALTATFANDEVQPPSSLRVGLLRLVDVPNSGPNSRQRGEETIEPRVADPQARWSYKRIAVLAAAAAVCAVATGVLVVQQRSAGWGSDTPSVALQDERTVTMTFPGGGTATISYSSLDRARVTMDHVDAPPHGHVYQLWLLGADTTATPQSAGIMDAATAGPDRRTTTEIIGPGNASTIGFTVEPIGGSTRPTAEPFASATLPS